jgi:DNA-binding NarL/FixJ family response regulator
MLEEIVSHFLDSECDIELAGTVRRTDGLPRKVAKARADVVLLGEDDAPLAAALLERSPRLKVLTVSEEGRDLWLYGLNPERLRLGPLSPDRLVQAVRRVARPRVAKPWWGC